MAIKYKRVLLKASGEGLSGRLSHGFDAEAVNHLVNEILSLTDLGIEVAVVMGGGNLFRGRDFMNLGFSRTNADHIGMFATTVNGLVLQQALQAKKRVGAEVFNSFSCDMGPKKFRLDDVLGAFSAKKVAIFSGGMGHPFFTTDTAAALRALEISAGVILKGTNVDGVYTKDPRKGGGAEKIKKASYSEVIARGLKVMDGTAIALCQGQKVPIYIFDLFKPGSLLEAISEQKAGSLITGE